MCLILILRMINSPCREKEKALVLLKKERKKEALQNSRNLLFGFKRLAFYFRVLKVLSTEDLLFSNNLEGQTLLTFRASSHINLIWNRASSLMVF